jgi:hypothetical protein
MYMKHSYRKTTEIHVRLPRAHVEAPVSGSTILSLWCVITDLSVTVGLFSKQMQSNGSKKTSGKSMTSLT